MTQNYDSTASNVRLAVGPVPFDLTNLEDATQHLVISSANRVSQPVRLANAYCVVESTRNSNYLQLLLGPGKNYPDGLPIARLLARKARRLELAEIPGQVRGPSLFENVLDRGRQYNRSHFLMGTTEDTLDILRESIQNRYPGTNIVGSYAPEFGPLNTAFLDLAEEAISPTEADIVWVALGSPKQDFAARELADRLNCTCIGVGAAFDFLAGTTKEAPTWMRKNGFEWLFRLASEPRRLWKRYLIGNLTFLRLVALQSLREKKPPSQDQRR